MWLMKIILCWCCVFTGHFTNGSNLHSSEIKTQLINHTMELIKKEFSNNLNTVIITYDLVDNQIVSGNANNEYPIIVVNGDLKRQQIYRYYSGYPTYVVAFESIQKLFLLILKFLNSPIWSIKSPIFILDTSERSQTGNASNVLEILGNFDILVSYYLRYYSDKDSNMIYTLSPYTQRAPLPWNQVRFANSNNKIKLPLFSLHYPKDSRKQNVKIYFDKTQYLDSHVVKILELVNLPNLT
ncbi:uncharacterized protein LOC141538123 [Cotesia typhae]|uniref:uncharacterized protein LOC141538123 n=1 Tax=Cotesia typhae TaxID=2053667 RepID=UPI003D68F960